MSGQRAAVVLFSAAVVLSSAPAQAQPPAGGGMRGGMMAAGRDSASTAMMRAVHDMVMNHDKLRRSVTNLPNGVRTVTESDDPALRQTLREHVSTTGEFVRTSHDPNMPMETPALRGVLRNGAKVTRTVEQTATGVVVVETSTDTATVALLQRHAAEVTDLVNRGMTAMHEAMMKNGAMGGGMRGGPPASGGRGMGAGMSHGNSDSAFAGVQARGKVVMGVDQYASTHHFETLSDGGRIELQSDAEDPVAIATIRTHLQDIAKAFGSGDFSGPAFVHMQTVPGAQVMAAKRSLITYSFKRLPRGGELRIKTTDAEAAASVAQFLAFQRMDHRAH